MLNKRTLELQRAFMAAGASSEVSALPPRLQPLELMLDVVNDTSLSLELRLAAARYAAPYVHHHKGQVDTSGRDVPLTVQILRFSDLAGEPERKTIEHDPQPPSVPPTSH